MSLEFIVFVQSIDRQFLCLFGELLFVVGNLSVLG